jgi:ABC-type phosphate/phosphonate transport system substrate-binding protein
MSGFVLYLLSAVGSVAAFKKAKLSLIRQNYFYAAIFVVIALAGSLFVMSRGTGYASAKSNAEWTVIPNQPVGEGKGIFPGRVVWVHDPAVASWDGKTGNWWDENVTSQSETDKMLNESLVSLTGEKTEKKAWTVLFKDFNSKHGRKNQSYKRPEDRH